MREPVNDRLKALMASATPKERYCARALCEADRADPDKMIRGHPLWLHFLPTVRNIMIVVAAMKEAPHG